MDILGEKFQNNACSRSLSQTKIQQLCYKSESKKKKSENRFSFTNSWKGEPLNWCISVLENGEGYKDREWKYVAYNDENWMDNNLDSQEGDELVLLGMEEKNEMWVKLEATRREDVQDGERNVITDKNEDW